MWRRGRRAFEASIIHPARCVRYRPSAPVSSKTAALKAGQEAGGRRQRYLQQRDWGAEAGVALGSLGSGAGRPGSRRMHAGTGSAAGPHVGLV